MEHVNLASRLVDFYLLAWFDVWDRGGLVVMVDGLTWTFAGLDSES